MKIISLLYSKPANELYYRYLPTIDQCYNKYDIIINLFE